MTLPSRNTWTSLFVVALLLGIVAAPVFGQTGDGFDPALQADIDQVEAQVQALRELEAPEALERRLVSEAELRELVLQDVLETYNPEDGRKQRLFYAALGFLPADTDLLQLIQDVLGEQVAGFYETEENAMYVLSAEGGLDALATIIYAHEYQHALQDGNFDLDALVDDDIFEENPDQGLALLALAEGDAQLVTLLFVQELVRTDPLLATELLGQIDEIDSTVLDSAPRIIQRELGFPYEEGLFFVQTIYEENGWRLVDEIYTRPPLSTEHILHPDLYLLYEEPHQVELPPLDDYLNDGDQAAEWELLLNHPVGEFYIQEHLLQHTDQRMARDAAAGWGGDQMQLYATAQDEIVVSWRLSWDTTTDAEEFNMAYDIFAANWTGAPPTLFANGQLVCWNGPDFSLCKTQAEGDTFISIGPDEDIALGVLEFQATADVPASG